MMIRMKGRWWPASAWHRYNKPKPGSRRKTMGGTATVSDMTKNRKSEA